MIRKKYFFAKIWKKSLFSISVGLAPYTFQWQKIMLIRGKITQFLVLNVGNTSISQYIEVEIMTPKENVFMRAKRWTTVWVGLKNRQKMTKKWQKIASKWPKIFPESILNSSIMRAYISQKKRDPDFENWSLLVEVMNFFTHWQ